MLNLQLHLSLLSPIEPYHFQLVPICWEGPFNQVCGDGTGTGQNRFHLGSPEPEPYSKYDSGSEYKKMKQKTKKKNLLKFYY